MHVDLGHQLHGRFDLLDHDIDVAADSLFTLAHPNLDLLHHDVEVAADSLFTLAHPNLDLLHHDVEVAADLLFTLAHPNLDLLHHDVEVAADLLFTLADATFHDVGDALLQTLLHRGEVGADRSDVGQYRHAIGFVAHRDDDPSIVSRGRIWKDRVSAVRRNCVRNPQTITEGGEALVELA